MSNPNNFKPQSYVKDSKDAIGRFVFALKLVSVTHFNASSKNAVALAHLQTCRQPDPGACVKPQCGEHMVANALISKLDE